MKTRNLLGLTATAVLLGACVPSVNPFFSEKDVVWDARLVGQWIDADDTNNPTLYEFDKADGKDYKLAITEKDGRQGQFSAHLFKLKNDYFIDLVPTDCNYATNQTDLVGFAMFPGHLVMHVTQFEPQLKIACFDWDWLDKQLKGTPSALAHHREGDRLLLTADTPALQAFLLAHLAEGELFGKVANLSRKQSASAGH